MTYREAVAYILDIPRFTTKNDLQDVKSFLAQLGDPQRKLKVIHVAGTNGKGSVCVYLDAMLRAEGKRVGLFTSPHLVKMNERIVIGGTAVDDRQFTELFMEVKAAAERSQESGRPHPTFFEFLMGMALTAFAHAQVEYAVMETGLGGRLDATNALEAPVCSVITSIGLDHQQILGDTLGKIAAEKAGILKAGTPVFYWEGEEESRRVIEQRASVLGIPCNKIGKNALKSLETGHKKIAFSCSNAYYGDTAWELCSTGCYQPENAILAMEVMRGLFGADGHPEKWRGALAKVTWAGRMEEVLPEVYIDGAHNISAVERFAESLAADKRKKIVLFSAVKDKDYEEMIRILCGKVEAAYYVVAPIADKRAADTARMKEVFCACTDRPVYEKASLREAWDHILAHREGEPVYCVGSLYLAGMVKAMLQEETDAGL